MFLLPTWNRPEQCAAVLEALRSKGPSSGVLWINGEEFASEYHRLCSPVLPNGWIAVLSKENLGALGALNKFFECWPSLDWYGFLGDDEFLEEAPEEWQSLLVKAAGPWGLAHGYENWNRGNRFQGGAVLGGDLVRAVGYLAVPGLWHGFGFDCAWEWMCAPRNRGGGAIAKIAIVPEIKVNHKHWMLDETRKDACYEGALARHEEDKNKFWDWLNKEMPLAAERVQRAKAEKAA